MTLVTLRGGKIVEEIAAQHQLHPKQVSGWKRQARDAIADVFSGGGKLTGPSQVEVKDLHAKIGKSAAENSFAGRAQKGSTAKQ